MRAINLMLMAAPFVWIPVQEAGAQTLPGVFPGDRIRVRVVSSGGVPQEGRFHDLRNDSLVLATSDQSGYVEIALDDVESMESFVRGSRQAGKGFLIGAGIGISLGVIVGFAGGSDDPSSCWIFCFSAGQKAVLGGLALGAGGGLVGLAIGAGTRTHRWRNVPLDHPDPESRRKRAGGFEVKIIIPFRP